MSARRTIVLATVIAATVVCLLTYRLVRANSDKPHSATLTWNPSQRATSYNIYRSTVSGTDYKIIGGSKETKYVDAPLPSGAVYYYVVTAVSDKGESKYSVEVKAEIP